MHYAYQWYLEWAAAARLAGRCCRGLAANGEAFIPLFALQDWCGAELPASSLGRSSFALCLHACEFPETLTNFPASGSFLELGIFVQALVLQRAVVLVSYMHVCLSRKWCTMAVRVLAQP
jgi:hypothetical protein